MDGFMDTIDALSSHKSRDDKIRILDDPHTGAFAIIYAIFYVLIIAYILGTVDNLAEAVYMAIVFVFARALVGIVLKKVVCYILLFLVQTSLLQPLFVLYGLLLVFL